MARWRKITKNLDQIRGDLARISIGYLSNTTLEAGVHKSQGTRSAGKLNCVHLIFMGTQCGICFVTLLALRIFGWLLGFWKICEPLVWCIPVTLTCVMG